MPEEHEETGRPEVGPRSTLRQYRFTDAERGLLCRVLMKAIADLPAGSGQGYELRQLLDRLSG